MQAIGLHFGHDASGAVLDQGGLTRFLNKERRTRVKHALGLSSDDLRELLEGASADAVLGLSSTQSVPMFHDADVEITMAGSQAMGAESFFGRIPEAHHYRRLITWRPDFLAQGGTLVREGFPYYSLANEGANQSYEAMAMVGGQTPALSYIMRVEGELRLDGRTYPARFYQHHYLHAQYAAHSVSPDRPALVLSGDGGGGPSFGGGGVYFWAPGKKLQAITPTDGWLGEFYDTTASMLGLGDVGGAGKLMGLAPYGRPIYFDPALVGTRWQVTDQYRVSMREVIQRWFARQRIDAGKLVAWNAFDETPPDLVADIAASAQLLLEHNILALLRAAQAIARRAGFQYEQIVLTGGLALNCPANSNLSVVQDVPVVVPPAVNDEGLSIGAAVAAYFDTYGVYPAPPANYAEAVYLGADIQEPDVSAAADRHGWRRVQDVDPLKQACALLLEDKAVGICSGRSEVGPRALGHRSILANPASTGSWAAVNRLKRREPWRPFAPAVLQSESATYFDRGPAESRYMLFNYRSRTQSLPAVTHFDHTSRLQHVGPETGLLYDLLVAMTEAKAPGVVMNTSFNGPGVPIVETAEDAFAEATKLGLGYILTDFGLFAGPATP